MSTEAITQARTNLEAMRLATADAEQARRVVLLWQRHVIREADIPDALGISPSGWIAIKKEGDGPPLFQLGRYFFARTRDLRAWLDRKARSGKLGAKKLRSTAGV